MKCLRLGVADASCLKKCHTGVCSALKALGIPMWWVDNRGLAPSTQAASCFTIVFIFMLHHHHHHASSCSLLSANHWGNVVLTRFLAQNHDCSQGNICPPVSTFLLNTKVQMQILEHISNKQTKKPQNQTKPTNSPPVMSAYHWAEYLDRGSAPKNEVSCIFMWSS